MTINDLSLLGKKILVGIIITTIPFIIIFGGLWLTQKLLSENHAPDSAAIKQPNSTR
ncbi:hypothetical protein [Pedobacter hartonius]|uniref:Uncharacterized protein n=1 Tax=Pedobacter hartonius TaxID=425514 RepID=A0A1H3W4U8_9SPHI|nr:hypothetical protein [Pedobacter hartonius]SDZ82030.1 hypothetical protein SAMN05443550_10196 [Pedobacter hartonius]